MLRAWVLVVVGVAGLVSLRAAYDLTYEPAPGVRVRWRDGISDARRTWLEWKYRLTDPAAPQGLSYWYVLHDTSRDNIETMIQDPDVADTGDIDRGTFEVPFDTASYSTRWMWMADRTPGLRRPIARWTLVIVLAGMVVRGSVRILTPAFRRARSLTQHG